MRNILIATAVAAALLVPASLAQAKTNIDVTLGMGNGYNGYGMYNTYDDRNWNNRGFRNRVSCQEGKRVLRREGFRSISAFDCVGRVYGYEADRNGRSFIIKLHRNGNILDIRRDY